jgi:hypothetical protein
MTTFQHRDLAGGRWWTMPLALQMGNIGSELSRALKWRGRNERFFTGALARAVELSNLTLTDPRYRRLPGRLKELARAREVLLDFLVGPNEHGSSPDSLQRYYDAFALAAARERAHGEGPADTSPSARSAH